MNDTEDTENDTEDTVNNTPKISQNSCAEIKSEISHIYAAVAALKKRLNL